MTLQINDVDCFKMTGDFKRQTAKKQPSQTMQMYSLQRKVLVGTFIKYEATFAAAVSCSTQIVHLDFTKERNTVM